jgi:hypothetical protein
MHKVHREVPRDTATIESKILREPLGVVIGDGWRMEKTWNAKKMSTKPAYPDKRLRR